MFLISQSFVDVYKKDSNTTLNFWIIMSVMWSSEWVTEYNPIIFDSYIHATIPKWLSFGNVEWLTSVLMYSILESPTYHPFAVWVVTNKKLIKEMYTLRTRRSSRGTYRQSRHANLQPIHIAPGVAVSNQRSVCVWGMVSHESHWHCSRRYMLPLSPHSRVPFYVCIYVSSYNYIHIKWSCSRREICKAVILLIKNAAISTCFNDNPDRGTSNYHIYLVSIQCTIVLDN